MKPTRSALVVAALVLPLTLMALAVGGSQEHQEHPQEHSGDVQDELTHVRADLDAVKNKLEQYACCVNPSCNFCALAVGVCVCDANIRTAVGVCGECLLGWHAGRGHSTGVEAADVKGLQGEVLKTMYDELAKHFAPHAHEHR